MEGNQEECRLCLAALNEPKDIWSIKITTSINEKICEIFPPELIYLQSTSNVICVQCNENLEICSSFRNSIVTKHQSVLKQVVKVESDFSEVVIIKTELFEADALFEADPDDHWDEFSTSSFEANEPIKKAKKRKNAMDCEMCTFTTPDKKYFKYHLQAEHEANPTQCGICEQTFRFTQEIRSHTKQIHGSDNISLKCLHCKFKTTSPIVLLKHSRKHRESYKNKGQLQSNEITNGRKFASDQSQETDKFTCDVCGKQLKISSLKTHMERAHGHGECLPKFSCDFCGKRFFEKNKLNRHVRTHIPRLRRKDFQCDVCLRFYCSDELMKDHKNKMHNLNRSKLLECTCGQKFRRISDLKRHKKRTHERPENEKACEMCGITMQKSYYNKHVRIYHTEGGLNNFQCNDCGKLFNTQSSCKTHQKLHGEMKFVCEYVGCGKKYYDQRYFNRHTKIAHLNQRNSKCPYEGCEKAFATGKSLKKHVKLTHEKLRKKCPVDGCTFHVGRIDYMRNHLKKHGLSPTEYEKHYKTVKEMNLV